MSGISLTQQQRAYLLERFGLEEGELELLLEDLWSFTSENPEVYVLRRHRELQGEGWSNESIFRRLVEELGTGRFAAAPRTTRQIRRMIYG